MRKLRSGVKLILMGAGGTHLGHALLAARFHLVRADAAEARLGGGADLHDSAGQRASNMLSGAVGALAFRLSCESVAARTNLAVGIQSAGIRGPAVAGGGQHGGGQCRAEEG